MFDIIKKTLLIIVVLTLGACSNSNAIDIKETLIIDSSNFIIEKENEDTITVNASIIINYTKDELMGRVVPKNDTSFSLIEKEHTAKSKIYLRKEAYSAFCRMYDAAKKDGFKLNIISAFRSNYHQQLIWESKWIGKRKVNGQNLSLQVKDEVERAKIILQYSSMPGSSRHHWGTDVDIYSLENSTFESGYGLKIYSWLQKHAAEYGFYQVYTAGRSVGYNEEKWHWSYLPIAKPMLDAYKNNISTDDFKGFKGSKTAKEIGIIDNYVLGINVECLNKLELGIDN